MKFRKKPIVIEAWPVSILLADASHNWRLLPKQILRAYEKNDLLFADNYILIQTPEGKHRADFNDLIVCGVHGELYPCKPEIFAKTYEPAEPYT